jgi:ribosomal-protein-alanine N-acetyltransferase
VTAEVHADGGYLIRPATMLEASALAALERVAQSHPWNENQLLQSVRDDTVFVVQSDTKIVAYCVMQIVLDEASLLNIVVLPSFRRRGIARQLLEHAFDDARRRSCRHCFLEVRASNESAIALYHQLGFVFDGVRRNYYPAESAGAREDAHLFHIDW